MKRLFGVVMAFQLVGTFFLPSVLLAQPLDEKQAQVNALLARLHALQQQFIIAQSRLGGWCHSFRTNLGIGDGSDVLALQAALEKDGEAISITGMFDEQTASAVTEFQEKYADQILIPYGLRHGTGYVGPATRTKLNLLFGCHVPPVTTSTLTVAEILANQAGYANQPVTVRGVVLIQPLQSELPCGASGNCSAVLGIDLYLTETGNLTPGSIQIYQNGQPYPCVQQGSNYVCGNFVSGAATTITATLVKTQIADAWVGNSGGGPPTPIHWRDFYYLELN